MGEAKPRPSFKAAVTLARAVEGFKDGGKTIVVGGVGHLGQRPKVIKIYIQCIICIT